jgi:acyl transferase domain-containing protein
MKVAESIAIIGIGCRMPGQVGRPNDLWKLLAGAADAIC